ncbi:GNAT family N-acetyltransferase [Salinarimonas ramus]|uniref:GCN5 family acetyltransferase n=1 Tax=Salinarimonas ramus TaxID=690164 RepID=A0A917Q9K2_9HYPH|nr:GNAT family N-acetyltransferase [Salinarimonas ramus]GGK37237.1 GCN5 family acetyltransferase [Salinarimonas ramus]
MTRTPPVALRPLLADDVVVCAQIFRDAIEALTGEDYDVGQQEAWASAADDLDAFGARLGKALTIVAVEDGEVVGFASLEGNETFDMLYVAPDASGRGVATTLSDAIEKLAGARGTKVLSVKASDTALPFFMDRGYEPRERATVHRAGQWLASTTMTKALEPPQTSGQGRPS